MLVLLGLILLVKASLGSDDVLEEVVYTTTGICEGNLLAGEGDVFSHPVHILGNTRSKITFAGSFEDLLRERTEGKKTAHIDSKRSSLRFILPFRTNSVRSALAFSISRNTLASEWDSYKDYFYTSLGIGGYSSVLSYAISLPSNRLGVALKASSLKNDDVLNMEGYPRSVNEDRNNYFYDLLARTFGSSIPYASSNQMRSVVLEDVHQINNANRCGIKLRVLHSVSDISANYLNSTSEEDFPGGEDFTGRKTADSKTEVKGWGFEASYASNVNEMLDIGIAFGISSQQATWNIDPRSPKKKGEIYIETKHWSNGNLDALAFSVRGDLSCRLGQASTFWGALAFAKKDLSGYAFASTPVLGKHKDFLFLLPIVHKVNIDLSGDALSQLYEVQFERKAPSGLTLDVGLGFLYATLRTRIKGTPDFYGIEFSPFDQETTYRVFNLWIGDFQATYPLNEHLATGYTFRQYIPSAPRKEVDGKPAPSGPPGPEKETRGGGIHTVSLGYTF